MAMALSHLTVIGQFLATYDLRL